MKGTRGLVTRMMLLGLLGAGCASFGSAGGAGAVPRASRCYTEQEVARIEMLREHGDTAEAVAEMVGGTAADVRRLERQQRAQRLAGRPAPAPDAGTCPEGAPPSQAGLAQAGEGALIPGP